MSEELHTTVLPESNLEMRSESKRELDIRLVPWNTVIDHNLGPEMFVPGAFAGTNPEKIRLVAPDNDGAHRGPTVGRGISLEERDDGAYMTFKVSKTQAGDELLTLVSDGVVSGASVAFNWNESGSPIQQRSGRRVRVHERVGLDHVLATWKPAYEQAAVLAMRSAEERDQAGEAPMAESTAPESNGATEAQAAPSAPAFDFSEISRQLTSIAGGQSALAEKVAGIEERSRSEFIVPKTVVDQPKPKLHEWASAAARMLTGGRIDARELQERALADVISSENPGQIPEAFVNDLLGIVTARRPFMASTRQIAAPSVGLSITVPVFDTHSTVGVQSEEKTDIDSTALKVTTDTFDAITIAGGADVAMQLIRRGEPSFMDLLMRDLGAAYATAADLEAVASLLAAGTTAGDADLDPENLEVGDAWQNSISAIGTAPDTVWLSSTAVAEFIDAKDNGTNRPLYFNLNANFAAGTGTGGNVSALRPVYTPALDGSGTDVLIGPSDGFAWAEDGTFTLQVDVPSRAGRDVAIVGILFLIPRYPSAFTSYGLAS